MLDYTLSGAVLAKITVPIEVRDNIGIYYGQWSGPCSSVMSSIDFRLQKPQTSSKTVR